MVSACVMYPLDLLKTRMQAGKPGEHTLLRAGRAVVREDGMSGLYRGLRTDLLKVRRAHGSAPVRPGAIDCALPYRVRLLLSPL